MGGPNHHHLLKLRHTPAIEEERFIHCLLLSTHPDRYMWCTRIHHLVGCLRTELLNAQRMPRPAPRNPTPNILPPNQPQPPAQSSTDPQPRRAQAPGTGSASPSTCCNHTPQPPFVVPARHKAPPPDCITVPKYNATLTMQTPLPQQPRPKAPPPVCTSPHKHNVASTTHTPLPHEPPLSPPLPDEPPPVTQYAHPVSTAHRPAGDWWQTWANT